ncbi:hypothetical protein QJS10_CPA05g00706 [Acorus calamus]|uniref:Uncharacterized protein n=1 Tax=Acorus calamus TaxID=4465 RepID=A0AAV9EU58_ACOCL|nr:hypothetical protein QJS10_CPA05g00706 [Acorus calamus]
MMTDNDKDVFLCPDLEVVSWLGFRFHEMDFGGGGLVGFGPTWVEAEGFVVFIPGLGGGGGGGDDVDVVVVMFEEHAKVMKRISHYFHNLDVPTYTREFLKKLKSRMRRSTFASC